MDHEKVVIVDGARTPVGSFGGTLKDVPAHELGGMSARAAIRRAGVESDDIEAVVMGCIGQVVPTPTTPDVSPRRLGCPSGRRRSRSTGCAAPDCRLSGRLPLEVTWNRLDFTLAAATSR